MNQNNNIDIFFQNAYKHLLNITLIFVILTIIAIVPLQIFPKVQDNSPHWLTSSTVKFTNNWLKDGVIKDKFIMLEDPNSIETQKNRAFYVSYPPGTILPIYFAAKICKKTQIDFNFVKQILKLEYFLLIYLIGFLFYFCLVILKIKNQLYQICIPIFLASIWSFLPFNYYHMRNAFFSDQLVIFYAIIFFFLEFLIYSSKNNKPNCILQTFSIITVFLGCLTDYYFYTIIFVAFCIRIMNTFQERPEKNIFYKIFSQTWQLILPFILSVLIFVYQLNTTNGYSALFSKFIERTSSTSLISNEKFFPAIINNLNQVFPYFFIILVTASILCLIYLLKKRFKLKNTSIDLLMKWEILVIFSALIHTLICKNHSIVHEFSMIKYNFVFVFILFGVFAYLYPKFTPLPNTKEENTKEKISYYIFAFLIMLTTNNLLIISSNNFYKIRIAQNNSGAKFVLSNPIFYDAVYDNAHYDCAKFVAANTNFNDVVYSPDYEIPTLPPQALSISKKRVYHINKINDIPISDLPQASIINILLNSKTAKTKEWKNISKVASTKILSENNIHSDKFIIYKIPYKKFKKYYNF